MDRDGTLIVDKDYLKDPAEVVLERGVIAGLRRLQAAEFPLVVVSNQSGVGRGRMSVADVQAVNARVDELLREQGIVIAGWYFCPHTQQEQCACRKPLPAMALQAAQDLGFDLDLGGSYVIGDKRADLELGDAIVGHGILLTTGHGREHLAWARANARPVFDDFAAAADYILDGPRVLFGNT